ncbi:MAG TPA: hypothetical protein VEK06_01940, partial [Myxococcota bacterium]|nr:hypothetical protein [Myxococcota bacterium]
NIVRIGAFHGRDDAFYQSKYNAKLWAFSAMEFSHGERLDVDLAEGRLPIKGADLIQFKTTKFPEALILLHQDDGILISCDSIKNWTKKDRFFDEKTFSLMKAAGSIGEAAIDETWLNAMKPAKEEIEGLLSLKFSSLISAHGSPLLHKAKAALKSSIQKLSGLVFLETQRLRCETPSTTDLAQWVAMHASFGNQTAETIRQWLQSDIAHFNKHGFAMGSVYEKDTLNLPMTKVRGF